MKTNLLKMATVVAIAASITFSCTKEVATVYPSEITMENWKDFVHAPDEVIERFVTEELESRVMTAAVEDRDLSQGRAWQLGRVRAWSGTSSYTGNWQGIQSVLVTNGNATSPTNSNGYYIVNTANTGTNQVCMNYNTAALNGVSTLDLVIIQRHILGISPFENVVDATDAARRYVASDVNHDGSIDSDDIDAIRETILGITTALPGNNMTFVPEGDMDLALVTDPWGLSFLQNNCRNNASYHMNRYAVKMGDVSGNFSF